MPYHQDPQDVYHAPSNAELFQKRIRQMAPPEVRVSGSDPALWDWDGPDQLILPGDKYSIDARGGKLDAVTGDSGC